MSFWVHLVPENSALEQVEPAEMCVWCWILCAYCFLVRKLEKKNPVCMSYSWLITCKFFCMKNDRNAYCFSELKTWNFFFSLHDLNSCLNKMQFM